MSLIYVAEDDEDIREVIRAALTTFQYDVQLFADGQALLDACAHTVPDCILLDIMMPVLDGITTLHRLRAMESVNNCPILMLTAKTSQMDKVSGLEAGADDYITKPFSVLELGARVKAALRAAARYRETPGTTCRTAGSIELNEETRTVTVGGKPVDLTRKEYDLLLVLWNASPGVVPRSKLLQKVWGYSYEGESRTLDMHIRSLRVKLDNIPCIHTVRGVGYRFLSEETI